MQAAVGQALRLNLGCGTDTKPGWVNVDAQSGPGVDVEADIHFLPWGNDLVDEMLLKHVIEHLVCPLTVMQELWRVARDGCLLTIRCPHGASDDAWEDPTHVRPYFPQSFGYFSQPYHFRSQAYGYTADWQPESAILLVERVFVGGSKRALFERMKHERNLVREMVATLRAVKPARERKKELQVLPIYDIEAV